MAFKLLLLLPDAASVRSAGGVAQEQISYIPNLERIIRLPGRRKTLARDSARRRCLLSSRATLRTRRERIMSIIRHPIWQYAYFVNDIDEAA